MDQVKGLIGNLERKGEVIQAKIQQKFERKLDHPVEVFYQTKKDSLLQKTIIYRSRMSHGENKRFNKFSTCFHIYTAEEFIAAIVQHIPEKSFQNTNPLTHSIKTMAFASLNIERRS